MADVGRAKKNMMSIFLFFALPGLSSLEDCLPLIMKQEGANKGERERDELKKKKKAGFRRENNVHCGD